MALDVAVAVVVASTGITTALTSVVKLMVPAFAILLAAGGIAVVANVNANAGGRQQRAQQNNVNCLMRNLKNN